ncbi:MAG: alpha/beta hydrolase [Chloroflexi bacterium]|nr:alpha/beta hydrolase [Chloroflexota bacterium]
MPPPSDRYVELSNRHPDGGMLRLHYRDWGGEGLSAGRRRPPLLLLHGLASNARIWDLAAPYLTSRVRVIALDQRGHGLSDKPVLSEVEGQGGGYGFAEVTADLAAFIEALRLERPVIVGHSWGASVALRFAVEYPDQARAVALVDGGFASMAEDIAWERAEKMMTPPDIDGMPVQDFIRFARNWPDWKDLWSEQFQEILLSNFHVSADGKIYRRLPIAKHMLIARANWEQRPESLWTRLSCPVLLVPAIREPRDEREEMWLKAKLRGIEAAQAKLPGCRVLSMEDTIHDIPVQRPRELAAAIIEFAEGLP